MILRGEGYGCMNRFLLVCLEDWGLVGRGMGGGVGGIWELGGIGESIGGRVGLRFEGMVDGRWCVGRGY